MMKLAGTKKKELPCYICGVLKDVSIYLMGCIALWEIQENALMDQTFFKGTAMSEPHLHQF